MKICIQLLLLVILSFNIKATILRCNNNPGVTGTYLTLDSAIEAASDGDTIHVEPSSISYGSAHNGIGTPVNNLTIIGNGFELGSFQGLQADTNRSKVTHFQLFGNKHKIIGITMHNLSIHGDSCQILNCAIAYRIYIASNYSTIKQCRFGRNFYFESITLVSGTHDIEVLNCYIPNFINMNASNYNIIFGYNTFADITGGILPDTFHHTFYNTLLSNNIFKTDQFDTTGNNTFINNVASDSSIVLPSIGGNVSGIPLASMFANPTSDTSADQQLLPGFNPQQVGMFAGNQPFKLGCLPPVPSIFQLLIPSLIQSNTSIITISTRTNQ